jgi:hypothetical protein
MKVFLIHILLAGLLLNGDSSFFSVNYIGKDKIYIEQYIKENHKALKLNTSNINNSYKYLKFEDKINEVTVLFFLSDDDKCTLVRLMGDYSNINDIVFELNSLFTKTDKSNWKFIDNNRDYLVNLEEGDWFFTVTIKEMQ